MSLFRTGTKYVKSKTELGLYDTAKLVSRNWENVDLSKESMWDGDILLKNSIQYSVVEELKASQEEMKETLSEHTVVLNAILEWADECREADRFPLPKIM